MGASDLFRNLEWQIETYLVPKTIEHLRKNWCWNIEPEENLTRAVTSVVPFILESHNRWGERMAEIDRDPPKEACFESDSINEADTELKNSATNALQELKEKFKQSYYERRSPAAKEVLFEPAPLDFYPVARKPDEEAENMPKPLKA